MTLWKRRPAVHLHTHLSVEDCIKRLESSADMINLLNPVSYFGAFLPGGQIRGWTCGSRFAVGRYRVFWHCSYGFYGRLIPDASRGGTRVVGRYAMSLVARAWFAFAIPMSALGATAVVLNLLSGERLTPLDVIPWALPAFAYLILRLGPWLNGDDDEFLVDYLKRTLSAQSLGNGPDAAPRVRN